MCVWWGEEGVIQHLHWISEVRASHEEVYHLTLGKHQLKTISPLLSMLA
jgi:hypothetical protein